MKKFFLILFCLSLISCSNNATSNNIDLQEQTSSSLTTNEKSVDIDLSSQSETMVISTLNSILMEPETYLGKSIKIKGIYTTQTDIETNVQYSYVSYIDTTSCCTLDLEYRYDNYDPNKLPKLDDSIEIVGVLKSYEENDNTYYYIDAETFEFLV